VDALLVAEVILYIIKEDVADKLLPRAKLVISVISPLVTGVKSKDVIL